MKPRLMASIYYWDTFFIIFIGFLSFNMAITVKCPQLCKCQRLSDNVNLKVICTISRTNAGTFFCPNNTKLAQLKISLNKSESITTNLLRTCRGVRYLTLDGSSGIGIHLKTDFFASTTVVKYLSLKSCGIPYLSQQLLRPLRWLHNLQIGRNKLRNVNRQLFQNTQDLMVFNAEYNEINFIAPFSFADVKQLKSIMLNNNKLRTLRRQTFSGINKLLLLNLGDNLIDVIEPGVFDDVKYLKYLFLDGNRLRTLTADSMNGLKNMNALYLEDNRITFIEREVLSNMEKLSELTINDNKLRDFDASLVLDLPSLEIINIEGNPLPRCLKIHERIAGDRTRLRILKYPICATSSPMRLPATTAVTVQQKASYMADSTQDRMSKRDEVETGSVRAQESKVRHTRTVYIERYPVWLIVTATATSLGLMVTLSLLIILWRHTFKQGQIYRKGVSEQSSQPMMANL